MAIVNCKQCGKIFNKTVRDICPDCIKEEQMTFEQVRTYLLEHKMATLPDVVRDVDVGVEEVVQMIEEGKIILRDNPNFSLNCERCGALTQEGRYCRKCKEELAHELANATESVRRLRQTTEHPTNAGKYYSR